MSIREVETAEQLAADLRPHREAWDALVADRPQDELNPDRVPALLHRFYRQGVFEGRTDLFAVAVTGAWIQAGFPGRVIEVNEWTEMFDAIGFVERWRPSPRPAAIPTLFRGAAVGAEDGMAWSDDMEKARWFLGRERLQGRAAVLLQLEELPPAQVLAYIGGPDWREDCEWVLRPGASRKGRLRRLEQVDGRAADALDD